LRRNGRGGDASVRDMARPRAYLFDGWVLDVTSRTLLAPSGENLAITSGDFKLLEAFLSNANRVLSRDRLLDLVYENDTPAFDRSIDVRIGRVRKKLGEDPRNPRLIKTVRNDGYIFVGNVRTNR
jgi:DNA-binding response OmpR family regulator